MIIKMPRGDTRVITITISSDDDELSNELTEIYFTVKKNYFTKNALLQKRLTTNEIIQNEDGLYQFEISPEDTDNLGIGNYVFDIELVYDESIKSTTLGVLMLTPEVTFACNEGDV